MLSLLIMWHEIVSIRSNDHVGGLFAKPSKLKVVLHLLNKNYLNLNLPLLVFFASGTGSVDTFVIDKKKGHFLKSNGWFPRRCLLLCIYWCLPIELPNQRIQADGLQPPLMHKRYSN